METLRLNRYSVWSKYVRTFWGIKDESTLSDICSYRAYSILPAILLPFTITSYIIWELFRYILDGKHSYKNDNGLNVIWLIFVPFILSCILTFVENKDHISLNMVLNIDKLTFYILSYFASPIIGILILLILIAFLAMLMGIYKLGEIIIEIIKDLFKSKNETTKVKKPTLLGEFHKSLKEKYCTKIEWF